MFNQFCSVWKKNGFNTLKGFHSTTCEKQAYLTRDMNLPVAQ